MKFDLHCHSKISDGVLTPREVVHRAVANGVTHLALTDHDDIRGLDEARAAATECGIHLINGVELSTEWQAPGKNSFISIHIVILHFDSSCPELQAGLTEIRSGRLTRAEGIAAALAEHGINDSLAGAMKYAANKELISRSHFARYLVEIGKCRDIQSVFNRYLVPGKPGYVAHRWVTIEQAVAWAKLANGVAVLAHPGRYPLNTSALDKLINDFIQAGGEAIEVNSSSHSPLQMRQFAKIANKYQLLASIGSDFHAPSESYYDLGKLPPLSSELTPVWHKFSELTIGN